jgi:hypothetical protein
MAKRTTGRYVGVTARGERVDAFVPLALPVANPPLAIDGKLDRRLREAEQALVRLDLAGEIVPSLDWFISFWMAWLRYPMKPWHRRVTCSAW